eukprot:IDg7961t1
MVSVSQKLPPNPDLSLNTSVELAEEVSYQHWSTSAYKQGIRLSIQWKDSFIRIRSSPNKGADSVA